MSFDIVLLLIVVGGIGLSAAYVRAEYVRWRDMAPHNAAEKRRCEICMPHDCPISKMPPCSQRCSASGIQQ